MKNALFIASIMLGASTFAYAEMPTTPTAATAATTTVKTETAKTTATANTAKTTEGGMTANAKTKAGSLLDINAAPASELKQLPGISDETANKIVAGRPYKTKADLVKRNLLTKEMYEKVKPMVIAHTISTPTSTTKNVKNVTQ